MPVSHILLAIAMAAVTSGYTSLVSHPLTLMAPSIFTFCILFISSSDPKARLRPIWFFIPTMMILLTLMSANESPGKITSLIHSIGMFIPFYALLYASPSLRNIVWVYALASSVLLLCWVGAMAMHVEQFEAWAINGTGGSGNLLAAQLNMLFPFLYQTYRRHTGALKTLAMVLMPILCVFVVLLMSRSGIASLMCTVVLLFMFNHRRAALTVCAMLMAIMQFQPDLLHADTVLETLRQFRFVEYESKYSRTTIWGVAGDAIRENPMLGVGPGNSDDTLSILDMTHAHNNVIQVALEMGVVCAGIVLLISVYASLITVKLLLGDHRKLIAGLPVFSYLIYSITASPIQHPEVTLLLVITMNHALTIVEETGTGAESKLQTDRRGISLPFTTQKSAAAWSMTQSHS
jgi:O-antigen ligase